MTDASATVARQVRQRALGRCEYCLMHQSLQVATFHLEHIVPLSAGGATVLDNLAFACPTCNLHKSDRVTARDPETELLVPLFHPRKHFWTEHFAWSGYHIIGATEIGRATLAMLDLNHSRRLKVRMAEENFGLFPP